MENDQKTIKMFRNKALIIKAVRDFFEKEGFIEVDTPTLVNSPDPSPFNEVFKIEEKDLYLTPSPEFFIKKLLSLGIKNVYQITKAYRDWQENDPVHLNEFTILEWYRDNATYLDLMNDCENLVLSILHALSPHQPEKLSSRAQSRDPFEIKKEIPPRASLGRNDKVFTKDSTLIYQGIKINLAPPWNKITCKEAFEKYASVNLDEFLTIDRAREICKKHGYQVSKENSWEELYHQVFLNEVEPKLPKEQPLFLYDYPAPLAALSKIKESDKNYAERVEFYIGGLELGNGYSELTDPVEQEKRLKEDLKSRKQKNMKVFNYDFDFVEALKSGIPKTAGIAVGIDRLIMLFTDSANIHEASPFAL